MEPRILRGTAGSGPPTRHNRPMRSPRLAAVLSLACAMAGCATRSGDVKPSVVDPATFSGWGCEQLVDESDKVQWRAADVAYAVDSRVGNNMIALGLGVTVFWPALLAMRPDGLDAVELASLKGRFEALKLAADQQKCPPPPETMSAARASLLPMAAGERLVYEDRAGASNPRELGMKVLALRRDQIEFKVDVGGRSLPGTWRQDLAGNPLPEERGALVGWQRLLQPDLKLGQVVAGELRAAGALPATARVRGQVVALGPQVIAGRQFEVAVIELFGDAPGAVGGNARIDGVMAVDRRNGLLLRLELRCDNPDYALRRRLLRVESAPA
jgi:hypothetical protein